DAIARYNGWSFQTAWMFRGSENPITRNPGDYDDISYVVAGNGFGAQLSYVFENYWEVTGRFSNSKPKKEIDFLLPESTQFSFGITKYVWEHSFKMQAELTNEQLRFPNTEAKNNWYLRFQIELG